MVKVYWFCGHEQFQPEELVEHARLAEQAGFDGVMTSEHFMPWVDDRAGAGFAFSTLGAMAEATKKLELMTAVTSPLFRFHPAVVAQAAATIDRLSSGRFTLGVGSGRAHDEEPLGFQFPSYVELSKRLEEAVQIMRRMLDGEELTFDGQFYQTKQAKLYSPPAHHVPIYIAAAGPKTAQKTAHIADGVITSVKTVNETMEKVVQPILASQPKPNFTVVATQWTVFAQNDDEAWQALQAWRGLRAPNRDTVHDPKQLREAADKLGKTEILKNYQVVASPEEMIKAYAPLITELGADIIGIQSTSTDVSKLIELAGHEVVPALKQVKEG